MSRQINTEGQPYHYFQFGLLVTGETEAEHLPKLFKSLMESGWCTFKVLRRVPQLPPDYSQKKKKKLKATGTNKGIPDKYIQQIAWEARKHLNRPDTYVIMVDDLEHDRRQQAQQVFERYREILDTLPATQRTHASVHFLVNMLEAYYLADANAINAVLGTSLADYQGDVEDIRHPKNYLGNLYPNFKEKEHGGKILQRLNVEHVLSCPDTCKSLRTLFKWSVLCMGQPLSDQYQLLNGKLFDITRSQLDYTDQ
ncbi:DUF4276 family protein [Coleofasciculus sp. E2-BRE-01]|uniref:DUF4276 family protein n=1 Tax=Coleofasciculus sp. E2-BRE-01 TaxID=3069524 RepID=UPI0032F5D54C